MNFLSNPAVRSLIQPMGWMLLHSLWQMAAVALVLAVVLRFLRKSSANLRYLLACGCLFLMVLIPAVTLNYLETAAPPSAATPLPENVIVPSTTPIQSPPILLQPAVEPTPTSAPAATAVELSLKDRFIETVEPVLPYLAVIWLMGVFSLSLWHLGGWCQLQRLRKRMIKPVSERIEQRLSRLSAEMGIKKVTAIMESALVAVPTVIGWLKPVILLPASCLTGLTGEQLEALLAHELAHIKRYDYLVNILQTIVEILGFYHPAVWWVSHRIRLERENCCDDLAVGISGGSLSYARALTTLAEIHTRRPDLALTAAGGSLFHRIRRLAGIEPAPGPRPGWAPSIIALLFILALIIPATVAMTGKPSEDSENTVRQTPPPAFSQTLPNGLTVELVGICTHPSAGKEWWQPEGHPLGYDIKTLDISGYQSGDPGYEFVFRKTGDASFKIESVKGSDTHSGIQVLQPAGLAGFRVHIKSSYQKTNITISSPSGSWNTVVTSTGGGSYSGKVGNKTIVLAAAEQAGDDLIISSSDNLGYQLASRIIAVDSEGKVHEGIMGTDTGVNNIRQRTVRFKQLAFSQLAKFEFQTCPYEYCTFKNVSLRPEAKTDVQQAQSFHDHAEEIFHAFKMTTDPNEKSSKMTEALNLYRRAYETAPSDPNLAPWALKMMGLCYDHLGDEQAALETYKKAIALFPDRQPDTYYYLGTTYQKLGQTKEAIAALKKCLILCIDRSPDAFPYSHARNSLMKLGLKPWAINEITHPSYADLPNGVSVELVGICEHPSTGKPWWRPDGKAIEEQDRPYEKPGFVAITYPENKLYEVAVRVEPASVEDVGLVSALVKGTFIKINNTWRGALDVKNNSEKVDIKLGVATGPWQPEAYSTAKFGRRRPRSPGFAFTEIYNTDQGYAAVTVTHKKDMLQENYRVIAADQENKIHTADFYQSEKIDGTTQTTAHFKKLKANQIHHFEFQTRPYQWVTFKNVSLQPNFKTDVQIKVEKPEKQREGEEKEVGSKLEFRVIPEQKGPLTAEQIEQYKQELLKTGPQPGKEGKPEYIWLKVRDDFTVNNLVIQEYAGRQYLLASNRPSKIMLADGSWGLQRVSANHDEFGGPAIDFEFDEKASPLFYKLTAANLSRRLAIVINDEVISVPSIRSAVRDQSQITGNFTEEEVNELVSTLQKGMPPVQPRAEGQQPGFSPVIEITVNDVVSVRKNSLVDFDTGKLFSLPENFFENDETQTTVEKIKEWFIKNGIDVSGATQDTVQGLSCEGMIIAPMNNYYWDSVQAQFLATFDLWELGKPGSPAYMTAQGRLPVTYIFKTREGGIGILQIIGFNDEPKGVNIRYKMLNNYNGYNLTGQVVGGNNKETSVVNDKETQSQLYQKQDSIKEALIFIGTPEDRMNIDLVQKYGQLASPEQLSILNILFTANTNHDVNMVLAVLSDGTKREISNKKNMAYTLLNNIKDGSFFPTDNENAIKYFAVYREFTDEDYDRLKDKVSWPEKPSHIISVFHISRPSYMLVGAALYVAKDGPDYKLICPTSLMESVESSSSGTEGNAPKEYGIVKFMQDDEAYTKSVGWKYQWDIELSEDVSENNTFQFIKLTRVISGNTDLKPEVATQTPIDESLIEKYKYKGLKCRVYVGDSEPKNNYYNYGQKLSGWSFGFGIAASFESNTMFFPGDNIINIKANSHGNFIGSDLELLSFETSEGNIKYEHKLIMRKDASPEAKSAARMKLEQTEQRKISEKKLYYLKEMLTAYANDHNSAYPDGLDQIKPYDDQGHLEWLLKNIEYLGKSASFTEKSQKVLAYDKTLLEKNGSTTVLFNDGPVQYYKPDRLKKLGITTNRKAAEPVDGEDL